MLLDYYLLLFPRRNSGFEMGGAKVYLRRKKQILIFDTVEEADAFEAAEEAIAKAKKSSRGRIKKRLKEAKKPDVIDVEVLYQMVTLYGIQADLNDLIERQDFDRIRYINHLAMMMDEEDIEALLLA